MKYAVDRPFADPEAAARKLVEIASGIEPVQDGRIFIELVNKPFLKMGDSGDEFRAGIRARARARLGRAARPGRSSGLRKRERTCSPRRENG
ncbi:hypothetical protein [Bradyrhizobium sp. CCBAU 51745]|uniref:hypothetical protein n=1 Tax=Bradyrhizobium sp. CCBAU 51745 TaxID=1325099 RepID=UPI002FE38F59